MGQRKEENRREEAIKLECYFWLCSKKYRDSFILFGPKILNGIVILQRMRQITRLSRKV